MSIIYEALKKAEPKPSKNLPPKKNFLKLGIVLIFLVGAGYLLINYLPKKEIKLPEKQKEKEILLSPSAQEAKPPLPQRQTPQKEAPISLTLSGILYSKELPLAIINNQTLKIGEEIEGAKILDIKEDRVIIEKNNKRVTLFLK